MNPNGFMVIYFEGWEDHGDFKCEINTDDDESIEQNNCSFDLRCPEAANLLSLYTGEAEAIVRPFCFVL